MSRTQFGRACEQPARVAERAAGGHGELVRQGVEVVDVESARRAEVADLREVRPLLVAHLADEFRDEQIEVGVALAVRVRGHVDRHAVERGGEVGAVVEVEAAQVKLVRFPATGMLRDDDAGDGLDDLADALKRTPRELLRADHAFIRGSGRADQAVRAARHDHGFELSGFRLLSGRGQTGEAGGRCEESAEARRFCSHVRWMG